MEGEGCGDVSVERIWGMVIAAERGVMDEPVTLRGEELSIVDGDTGCGGTGSGCTRLPTLWQWPFVGEPTPITSPLFRWWMSGSEVFLLRRTLCVGWREILPSIVMLPFLVRLGPPGLCKCRENLK